MRVTARGALIGILTLSTLILALIDAALPQIACAACLASVLLVDLLFLPRGIDAITLRVGPRRCVAGRRFVEELLVESPPGATRLFGLQIREDASRRRDSAATVLVLDPGARVLAELDARFRERGIKASREFVLSCRSPFSCFVARSVRRLETSLCVEPARLVVDSMMISSLAKQSDERPTNSPLAGDEFWSLRELQDGEDLRRVHALRSMSVGALLVRETRGVLQTRVEIVLDLRAEDETMTQVSRFELALRYAASLSDLAEDPVLRLSATIVGLESGHESYELGDAAERQRFCSALASATPQAVAPLPRATLAFFERGRAGLRSVLIESGVEDRQLIERTGDSIRPLHVRKHVPQHAH